MISRTYLETLNREIKHAEALARRHAGKPAGLAYSLQAVAIRRLRALYLRDLKAQTRTESLAIHPARTLGKTAALAAARGLWN